MGGLSEGMGTGGKPIDTGRVTAIPMGFTRPFAGFSVAHETSKTDTTAQDHLEYDTVLFRLYLVGINARDLLEVVDAFEVSVLSPVPDDGGCLRAPQR